MRTRLVFGLALATALTLIGSGADTGPAYASHAGGADYFAIDMDPSSAPANTATSFGPLETCARIVNNGVQDADEDGVDTVTIDIVVSNIPSSTAMIAFGYDLAYDDTALAVQTFDSDFLLGATPGSQLFVAAEAPDIYQDGLFQSGAVDISDAAVYPPESGSGVLDRLTISADEGAPSGLVDLGLINNGHLDIYLNGYAPDAVLPAQIAIDYYCPGADYDGDGVWDLDEDNCGGVPLNASLRPERIDGAFSGVDDDGDTLIDEALPAGSEDYDCDGDGYTGSAESAVYSPSTIADQDPCGSNVLPPTVPPSPIGWPADLRSGSIPDSTNRVNIADLSTFTAPVRYLDTNVGTNTGDLRWDIVPGNSGLTYDINITDLSSLTTVEPAMLGGVRAYNGPPCPWPP